MKDRPQNTPLNEWPPAWLRLEVAALMDWPAYVMAHEHEKRREGAPITEPEMRAYIRARTAYR